MPIQTPTLALVCDDEVRRTDLTAMLRTAFPDAILCGFSALAAAAPNAIRADLAIVWAINNADFRRVTALHRAYPQLPIIAVGERDRSATAYMAGAGEYVTEHDSTKLAQAIAALLAPPESPGNQGVQPGGRQMRVRPVSDQRRRENPALGAERVDQPAPAEFGALTAE